MKLLRVLLITYHYNDKQIHPGKLGTKLKQYYERNSRGTLKIDLTSIAYKVPFSKKQFGQAQTYVKKILGFDVYVHFCNPKTSHAGKKHVITYASYTNTIHEFGHALGLGHGNMKLGHEKSKISRDPFDQMTMFTPYPSTNAVHRYQMGWFLPGELIDYDPAVENYTIGMLKDFGSKTSPKVIIYSVKDLDKDRKFFLSYGSKYDKKANKTFLFLTIHTIYGKASSFLIGMYKVGMDKEFVNKEAGLKLKVEDFDRKSISFSINPLSD